VVDVRTDPNTVVQTALLEPAATLEKLEYVLVITDFESVPADEPEASPSSEPSRDPDETARPSGDASPAP
ncbi:MAG: hypothetical protein M3432_03710, partial [Chloroflexota bacterium]|nr:hypothetical protein [Chloroflexota bacterium]